MTLSILFQLRLHFLNLTFSTLHFILNIGLLHYKWYSCCWNSVFMNLLPFCDCLWITVWWKYGWIKLVKLVHVDLYLLSLCFDILTLFNFENHIVDLINPRCIYITSNAFEFCRLHCNTAIPTVPLNLNWLNRRLNPLFFTRLGWKLIKHLINGIQMVDLIIVFIFQLFFHFNLFIFLSL